jgi:hypothetical protein
MGRRVWDSGRLYCVISVPDSLFWALFDCSARASVTGRVVA